MSAIAIAITDKKVSLYQSLAPVSLKNDSNVYAELFLKIALGTAEAIRECHYKKFDALIRNFGCQITALQVHQLVQNPRLASTAAKIARKAIDHLKVETHSDIRVSREFSKLARFHLLYLVNKAVAVHDKNDPSKVIEIPETSIEKLKKLSKIKDQQLTDLVSAIQSEESIAAADFIKQEALQLGDFDRSGLIKKALTNTHQRRSTKFDIVSLPLLYNTEASLRRVTSGPILVKNKLLMAGKPIEGEKEIQLFFQSITGPEISKENIDPKQSLVVIEGYIKNADALFELIHTKGLVHIINANCALYKQYASFTTQPLKDPELKKDLENYKKEKNIPLNVFEIDHVYCSILGDEHD